MLNPTNAPSMFTYSLSTLFFQCQAERYHNVSGMWSNYSVTNIFPSWDLEGSPQFQLYLIVYLVLWKVWNDAVPFHHEHSYVGTQEPFSEQRADLRAAVLLERCHWYIAFSVAGKHYLSSAQQSGNTGKSRPRHLFSFSAITENLEFLNHVLGLCWL